MTNNNSSTTTTTGTTLPHHQQQHKMYNVLTLIFMGLITMMASRSLITHMDDVGHMSFTVPTTSTTTTTTTTNTATSKADEQYEEWKREKLKTYHRTCMGWMDYNEYIERLFRLQSEQQQQQQSRQSNDFCTAYRDFIPRYVESIGKVLPGTVTLRRYVRTTDRSEDHTPPYDFFRTNSTDLQRRTGKLTWREGTIQQMWRRVNEERMLPTLGDDTDMAGNDTTVYFDMLLYTNDKPRVVTDLGLPAFVFSGEFIPQQQPDEENDDDGVRWVGYLPFPSHLYNEMPPPRHVTIDTITPNRTFDEKRNVLYYRGHASENVWKWVVRNDTDTSLPENVTSTPRFQLANATRLAEDSDVLDVRLTGFAVGTPDAKAYFKHALSTTYNITVVDRAKFLSGDSKFVLAVSGNGWAGNTMMKGILSGSCLVFIRDRTIDYENYTRDLGEVYFPLLRPDYHIVQVDDYYDLARTIREWNQRPDQVRQCAENGLKFAQDHLGYDCALDVIELLVWNYYKFVANGCPSAFGLW